MQCLLIKHSKYNMAASFNLIQLVIVNSASNEWILCPQGEEEVEETPAESLYVGMLPNLSQYVVSAYLLPSYKSPFIFTITSLFVCVYFPSDRSLEAPAGCCSHLQS